MTRNELIENNMGLVYFIVNKYFPTYRGNEDIIQIGMIGLCRAADFYDPNKGAFSTYAGKFIANEIRHSFRESSRAIKCSSLDRMVTNEIESDFYDIVMAEEVDFDSEMDRERFYTTLSRKQLRVVDGLKKGQTQAEIAKELGVSHQAVGSVVRLIRRKWRRYNGED